MCCFIGRQDDTFIYCYEVLLQKTTRRHFYLLVMIYCFKRRHSYLAVWYVPSEDDKTTLLFTGMMYCFIRRQDDTFIWQYDVPFIRRQDDTFIYWYDMLLHRTTRRHFYLLPHIIPVNNPPKAPGDFQKNPPYPGVLNVQFPAPIPRHGVGISRYVYGHPRGPKLNFFKFTPMKPSETWSLHPHFAELI